MAFTSTHKKALKAALTAWYQGEPDGLEEDPRLQADMEAAVRAYVKARGAKIVPLASTAEMRLAGIDVLFSQPSCAEGAYDAMLSASPDPFTDEVAK